MMNVRYCACLLMLSFLIACTATEESSEIRLFNGEDLTGWHGDMQYWRVEDGMIVGQFTEMPHNQFLYHEQEVDDFRLMLHVRVVGGHGNSGVQFRSEPLPNGHVRGPQADIGDGYWGKLYEEFGREWLWDDDECDRLHVDKEGWNEYEILAVDSRVRTAINGHVCVDLDDPYISRSGILAIQLHRAWAPAEIQFRDFRLELNPGDLRLLTAD